jgi:adenylosuccinate synthase
MEQMAGQSGGLIFEGAHAALLDHDHGYYPYVAKTDTTTQEALHMLKETSFEGSIRTLGVVRALGYRHGPGPFVTEDPRLSGLFNEKHNRTNEWQGNVRYGWFDLLAIRHGMRINQQMDAIALTMLDHLAQVSPFKICLSYEYLGSDFQLLEEYFEFTTPGAGRTKITGIKPTPTGRTETLSRLLFDCIPWDWSSFEAHMNPEDAFITFLESPEGLGVPVQIISTGPAASSKTERITVHECLQG